MLRSDVPHANDGWPHMLGSEPGIPNMPSKVLTFQIRVAPCTWWRGSTGAARAQEPWNLGLIFGYPAIFVASKSSSSQSYHLRVEPPPGLSSASATTRPPPGSGCVAQQYLARGLSWIGKFTMGLTSPFIVWMDEGHFFASNHVDTRCHILIFRELGYQNYLFGMCCS